MPLGSLRNEPVSFLFDGFNDYIGFGTREIFKLSSAFTIFGIFKLSSAGPKGIFQKNSQDWDYDYMLYLEGLPSAVAKVYFKNPSGTSRNAGGYTYIPDDQFRLLVGTYDGQALKIYVDGNLEGTTNIEDNIRATDTQLTLMKGWAGFTRGRVTVCGIYSRALSSQEVYEMSVKGIIPKDGLVLYISSSVTPTDDGKVMDLSGKGNHGTLYGGMRFPVLRASR